MTEDLPEQRTRQWSLPASRLNSDLPILEDSSARLHRALESYGAAAGFAWEEYFMGRCRNPHTRKAYLHAVQRFLDWCERHDVEVARVTPGMVGRYFDEHPGTAPTKKVHMSAIRGLFDILVERHVIVLNPALSVRTERFSATEGRTPEITVEQARELRDSIDLERPIDYRDRAIISMLIYTAARVGAIARLRVGDLVDAGNHMTIRFREKGGKSRIIPAKISLQDELEAYLGVLGETDRAEPLFRSAVGRQGLLSEKPVTGIDLCRMVKRRLKAAGLPTLISPHSFRACTATDLLMNGVPLDDVQYLLSHTDSRTTKLYDRRQRQVTRNIVERISV